MLIAAPVVRSSRRRCSERGGDDVTGPAQRGENEVGVGTAGRGVWSASAVGGWACGPERGIGGPLQDTGYLRPVVGEHARALGQTGCGLQWGHAPAIQIHRPTSQREREAPVAKAPSDQAGPSAGAVLRRGWPAAQPLSAGIRNRLTATARHTGAHRRRIAVSTGPRAATPTAAGSLAKRYESTGEPMARPHVMTPARRAALRKAQFSSAAKRRKTHPVPSSPSETKRRKAQRLIATRRTGLAAAGIASAAIVGAAAVPAPAVAGTAAAARRPAVRRDDRRFRALGTTPDGAVNGKAGPSRRAPGGPDGSG